jgi:hypothetical protein
LAKEQQDTFGNKQLRPDQKEAIKQIWGRRRPVLVAPAGWGKTLTGLSLFYFYWKTGHCKKCMVLAHSKGWSGYPKDNVFGFRIKVLHTKEDIAAVIKNPGPWFELVDVMVVVTSQLDEFHVGLFPKEKVGTSRKVLKPQDGFSKLASFVDFVILDEVHRYRTDVNKVNHTLAQFFRSYPRNNLALYITATLFYTSSLDTFQIMQYVDPTVFPNYWQFYEEFVDYRWKTIRQKITDPRSGFTRWQETEIREKLGNKNMDRLQQKLSPFVYLIKDERWTFHWMMTTYVLTPEENRKYDEYIVGLGLNDKLLKFSCTDLMQSKTKFLRSSKAEKIELFDRTVVPASEVRPGYFVKFPKIDSPYIVKSVAEEDDEAGITARLPALQKFLSTTEDKLSNLKKILDGDGALVYCQYHETANFLGAWAKKLWPHRKVSILTGGTTKVHEKIKSHDRSEIMFCTRAITESLNFYFHQMVIYESITNPGMLEQYVGRSSRSDASYSELRIYVLCGKETIDVYFWERLLQNINSLDDNPFQNLLPHSSDWDWLREYAVGGKVTFPILKKLLLWRGSMGMPTDDDDDAPRPEWEGSSESGYGDRF